jgi:hypothetical protein
LVGVPLLDSLVWRRLLSGIPSLSALNEKFFEMDVDAIDIDRPLGESLDT